MTAFRFVTLVCDTCFESYDPGTALTEPDARADAAARGWVVVAPDIDQCGRCSRPSRDAAHDLATELEIGEPVLITG